MSRGFRGVRVAAVLGCLLACFGAARGRAAAAAASPAVPTAAALAAAPAEFSRLLQYQSPADAVLLLRSVLSPTGTIDVKGKAVVVRDNAKRVARAQDLLEDFDHPRIRLRVVVQIVQAATSAVSPPESSNLAEPLLGRLRRAFPYSSYTMAAQVGFEANEGTDVSSEVGEEFSVAFRLGTLQRGQSVRLTAFSMSKGGSSENPLIDTNLVLALDRPLAVGLTTDETSKKAVLVILTCARVVEKP